MQIPDSDVLSRSLRPHKNAELVTYGTSTSAIRASRAAAYLAVVRVAGWCDDGRLRRRRLCWCQRQVVVH